MLFNPPAVVLIMEPVPNIQRKRYQFLIQTKYLSERQIFAEAFLRGLICGQVTETVSAEQRVIIDKQLQCDYEKWCFTGQDLTPVFMNHRATVSEITAIVEEVLNEITRLEVSGANLMAIGAQLDYAISCLKRTTIYAEELNCVRRIIQQINLKYQQICSNNSINNNRTNNSQAAPNDYEITFATPNNSQPSRYVFSNSPIQTYHRAQQQLNRNFQRFNESNPASNFTYNVENQQNSTRCPSPRPTTEGERENLNNQNGRWNQMNQQNVADTSMMPTQYSTPNVTSNVEREVTQNRNSMLNSRANNSLISPNKVSSTIITILSKNVYDPSMDAQDQLETWESQSMSLSFPVDYCLSFMEVLLSKDLQCWWQTNRVKIADWSQFKCQFLEDFGDHNRAIKAEQAIASLSQSSGESFQQLFLRFTKLMGHVKPDKSEEDKLYILKAALKPELRSACMTATTIAELKKICQIYEGMAKMYISKEAIQSNTKINANSINMINNDTAVKGEEETTDYWNNEVDWQGIQDEEDRVFIINDSLEKRKQAMNQVWSKEQKKEWLSQQMCFNCNRKGHLQGQCDIKWTPHCVKCGNKSVSQTKDCLQCSGNGVSSGRSGASA